jgi:predicted short-subunit dehydrogenase-like oxidoreductase (DUF2520 family)
MNDSAIRNRLRVGFIGAGRAGTSFGRYITDQSGETDVVAVSGYFSRTDDSAKFAAHATDSAAFKSAADLVKGSDAVFVTVPDDKIEDVFQAAIDECLAKDLAMEGKLFGHMSGSLSSEIFACAEAYGIGAFSIHPACAIPDRENAWRRLREAFFVIDGCDKAMDQLTALTNLLGGRACRIAPEQKILYHTACVFLSNLVCGLADEGAMLLADCGLDRSVVDGFLGTLFKGNAENISSQGTVRALTGPAERADAETVAKHIAALQAHGNENTLQLYKGLTKSVLRLAKEKNPVRDYAAVREIVLLPNK